MRLSYVDILGDGQRHIIEASITTDHPRSSYNQPVIVMPDDGALDGTSWVLLGYQVVQATAEEAGLMRKWLEVVYLAAGITQQAGGEPPVKEMTIPEAVDYAQELGESVTAVGVRRAALRGHIPGARRMGRDWLIPYDGFNNYLGDRPKTGPKGPRKKG